MTNTSAGVALGDELSAALARLGDSAASADDAGADAVYRISSGSACVALRAGQAVVIGRARGAVAEAFIGVEHQVVSRRHMVVRHDGDELIGEDLGSRNGTILVRGESRTPLAWPTVLAEGDRLLTVGDVELARLEREPGPSR